MTSALKIVISAAIIFAAWKIKMKSDADPETGEADDSENDINDLAIMAADAGESLIYGVDDVTAQQNIAAFLASIRLGEGTSDGAGYYRLCGGGNAENLINHPALTGWRGWDLPYQMAINAGFPGGVAVSTAAGAYQITRPTWRGCVAALGLTDFSEQSQDAAAIYLINQKGARSDVSAGRTSAAIAKLGNVWASLPGAAAKQRQVSIAQFNDKFTQSGGILA